MREIILHIKYGVRDIGNKLGVWHIGDNQIISRNLRAISITLTREGGGWLPMIRALCVLCEFEETRSRGRRGIYGEALRVDARPAVNSRGGAARPGCNPDIANAVGR